MYPHWAYTSVCFHRPDTSLQPHPEQGSEYDQQVQSLPLDPFQALRPSGGVFKTQTCWYRPEFLNQTLQWEKVGFCVLDYSSHS